MRHGLQVWNAAGQPMFDSWQATGGVCVGSYELSPGGSVTVNLSSYPGRQVIVIAHVALWTISYAPGYPQVTINVPSSYVVPGQASIFVY